MHTTTFAAVVREFCTAAPRLSEQRVAAGRPFRHAGWSFAVRPGPDDRLVLSCDLGPLPPAGRAAAYRWMLGFNLLAGRPPGHVLALDAELGHALLTRHVPLERRTAALLEHHMVVMATHAERLQAAMAQAWAPHPSPSLRPARLPGLAARLAA